MIAAVFLFVIIEFEFEVVIVLLLFVAVVVDAFIADEVALLVVFVVDDDDDVKDSDVPSIDEDDNRLDSLNSGDENEAVSLRLLFNEGDSFVLLDIIIFDYLF